MIMHTIYAFLATVFKHEHPNIHAPLLPTDFSLPFAKDISCCPHIWEINGVKKHHICYSIGDTFAVRCRFPFCRVVWLSQEFYRRALDADVEFYLMYFKVKGYVLWVPKSRQPKHPTPALVGQGYRHNHNLKDDYDDESV